MKGIRYFHYFVEGACERELINALKTELGAIVAGKVQILNPVQERIRESKVRTLRPGTCVVLVFDTDAGNPDILKNNIEYLLKQAHVTRVLCAMQVKNFEDELRRSCKMKKLKELVKAQRGSEFKKSFLRITNLPDKLRNVGFNAKLLWSKEPKNAYAAWKNEGKELLLQKSET